MVTFVMLLISVYIVSLMAIKAALQMTTVAAIYFVKIKSVLSYLPSGCEDCFVDGNCCSDLIFDKLVALYEVERDNRRSVYLVCTYM